MKYKVTQSCPAAAIFEGQVVKPDYEDDIEIIIHSPMPGVMHHVRKNGEFFKNHFTEVKS